MKRLCCLILFFLSITVTSVNAQNADELFARAREAAFEQKNYSAAISLSKRALAMNPAYTEIRVFLGRLYTWADQPDSARIILDQVLKEFPGHEDASVAAGNLAYWNDDSEGALRYVDMGLSRNPSSEQLRILKAKILSDLKRWEEADSLVSSLLGKTTSETEVRALAARIRENYSMNRIGLAYNYVYFDKQFANPWHLASLDYSRQTDIGPLIARVNYGRRFNANGIQFETDFYPRLSDIFQAYLSVGYSADAGVFPGFRAGASLYANLPSAFEAEVGFRFLSFDSSTWIYTASLGKYYKNFWFNVRTYLSPENNRLSRSLSFTGKYYFGSADDFFSVRAGTGLSPDNPQNNLLIGNTGFTLRSSNVSTEFRKSLNPVNVISVNLGFQNQEYRPDTRGNQFDIGVGYIRRF